MEEIQIISGACEAMGREIYEVSFGAYLLHPPANGRLRQMDIVCSMPSQTSYASWDSYRPKK